MAHIEIVIYKLYIAILCEPLSLLLFVKSLNLFLYLTGQPHNFPIDPSIYGECSYEGMFLGFSHWYLHLWDFFPCFFPIDSSISPWDAALAPDLLRMGIPQRKFLAELQRCRTFGYG